jgi:hypothetical protein
MVCTGSITDTDEGYRLVRKAVFPVVKPPPVICSSPDRHMIFPLGNSSFLNKFHCLLRMEPQGDYDVPPAGDLMGDAI